MKSREGDGSSVPTVFSIKPNHGSVMWEIHTINKEQKIEEVAGNGRRVHVLQTSDKSDLKKGKNYVIITKTLEAEKVLWLLIPGLKC